MDALRATGELCGQREWPALNGGLVYRDKISAADAGCNIVDFYARRYPQSASEAGWRHRLARAQLLVAGEVCIDPQVKLKQGTILKYHRLPWQEPDVPCSLPSLFEDEHVLAVSKPSGLQVLPGGPFHQRTALTLLQWWYSDAGVTPAPVHRLGRGTSGVLLCAKSPEARTALAADFAEATVGRSAPEIGARQSADGCAWYSDSSSAISKKRIAKTYRALVQGIIQEDVIDVDQPIGRIARRGVQGGLHAASAKGKPSRSRIHVLWRNFEDGTTLVDVDLYTGRPHQIRIHCAAAGIPLVGDPLYVVGGVAADIGDIRQQMLWNDAAGETKAHAGVLPKRRQNLGLDGDTQASLEGRDQNASTGLLSTRKTEGGEATAAREEASSGTGMEEDGGHSKGSEPLPGDCGYYLHAMRLAFNHPVTQERIVVVAAPPPMLCAPGESFERLLSCPLDET